MVMEDGAPPYRSNVASAAGEEMWIQNVPWPPHSPDLNPVDNPWKIMKSQINKREPIIDWYESSPEEIVGGRIGPVHTSRLQ